ncbi:MAG: ATP-dependent endonuclease [Cyanobacteria bacterium SIG26]|nr:ATP-dependent endonuclease [Cyanobacteria bacterium SIG26]
MEKLKLKILTKEQLLISLDRLTRFKETEVKYSRVFCDILTTNLISPKYKRYELENMDAEKLKDLVEILINYSVRELGLVSADKDYLINKRLYEYENSVFKLSSVAKKFLDNKICYGAISSLIDENSVKNLQWVKMLATCDDIEICRQNMGLHYPLSKIIIAEGATEEVLLPEFAKFGGYDFDKNGVHIISAGGKNQVVKLYYKLSESLKLPIFVLLDKDAIDNLEEIKPKLREIDKIHLLNCGEFEDLLPLELVKRSLDYALNNISIIEQDLFNEPLPRAKVLEEIFKTRGMHEFKKVEFAQIVKNNIHSQLDISPEIRSIIEELRLLDGKVTEFEEI